MSQERDESPPQAFSWGWVFRERRWVVIRGLATLIVAVGGYILYHTNVLDRSLLRCHDRAVWAVLDMPTRLVGFDLHVCDEPPPPPPGTVIFVALQAGDATWANTVARNFRTRLEDAGYSVTSDRNGADVVVELTPTVTPPTSSQMGFGALSTVSVRVVAHKSGELFNVEADGNGIGPTAGAAADLSLRNATFDAVEKFVDRFKIIPNAGK